MYHPKRKAEDVKARKSCSGQRGTKKSETITPISGNVADGCRFERWSGFITNELRSVGNEANNKKFSDIE